MTIFGEDHERVVVRQDADSGLRFLVAVHSTALGPSLGGMRLKPYPGGLREALDDVLALSRTMPLKASAAGLDLGGGKAVMIDDGNTEERERRLVLAAETIDELGGAYVTAEDIGTTPADMDLIARHTRFVVGRSPESGGSGDPSPVTAATVFQAIRVGLRAATGTDELDGRRVGVLGLGKVGSALAARLAEAGAHVIGFDLAVERMEAFGGEHAPTPDALLAAELDVLAPCAAGGTIDSALAGSLAARVVAGAANNPLTSPAVAEQLERRGILYVPDFLANCGGLIHVAAEWLGDEPADVTRRVERAGERLEAAIATARAEGATPVAVAERQALARVEAARAALPVGA